MSAIIKIINLKKKFNDHWVNNGINLEIPHGKMTVIIGRSGEGKSVLLKQVMGLIDSTSGTIIIDEVSMTDKKAFHCPEQVGYVFQFAALLDSLTIFENIGISYLENRTPRNEVLKLVKEKLSLVHLPESILDKYPSEISGGMRKRVGLARTLMHNPKIILYDEPTSGLDPITTCVIHELMKDMQQNLQLTSVIISHDITIFNYADYVALLHEGVIKYFGPAATIWDATDPYIYQFIRGLSNGPITADL